jgi:hypothetical protein
VRLQIDYLQEQRDATAAEARIGPDETVRPWDNTFRRTALLVCPPYLSSVPETGEADEEIQVV